MRKRAWSHLDKIDGRDWVKVRIWRLLTEMPFAGDLGLPRLERAVRDGDATLRRMRVELVGKWRALLCHRRRGDVPWINNATERAIGRSKIRVQDYQGVQERRLDAERVWADSGHGAAGTAWSCRSWSRRNFALSAWGAASSETRPKMPNRFWDGFRPTVSGSKWDAPLLRGYFVVVRAHPGRGGQRGRLSRMG